MSKLILGSPHYELSSSLTIVDLIKQTQTLTLTYAEKHKNEVTLP